MILKNGSLMIQMERGVVLAKMERASEMCRPEWAVWHIDPEGNTYSGSYFYSLMNALNEYNRRLDNGKPVEKPYTH